MFILFLITLTYLHGRTRKENKVIVSHFECESTYSVIVWPSCSVQFWTKWLWWVGTVLQRMWLALPCALCWTAWFMWICRLLYVASCFLFFSLLNLCCACFCWLWFICLGFLLSSSPPLLFFPSFLLFVHNCVFSWFYFSFYLAVEPSFRPHLYKIKTTDPAEVVFSWKKAFEGAVAATSVQKQLCSV